MFMVILHHSVTYVCTLAIACINTHQTLLCKRKHREHNIVHSTPTELQGSPTDGQSSACSERIGFGVSNRRLKRPPE